MFLFKKKKNESEVKTSPVKKVETEKPARPVKTAKPAVNDKKARPAKPQVVTVGADEDLVDSDDAIQVSGKKPGQKVVIPASALKEDAEVEIASHKEAISAVSSVPDEALDGLLVKVNRNTEEKVKGKPVNITAVSPEKTAAPQVAKEAAVPPDAPFPSAKPAGGDTPGADGKNKKGAEGESKENLFSNLFGNVTQEEESPLDHLIKSLPEITIQEVLSESEEVKGLISELSQRRVK